MRGIDECPEGYSVDGCIVCKHKCPDGTNKRCCLNCAKAVDGSCEQVNLYKVVRGTFICRHQEYAIKKNSGEHTEMVSPNLPRMIVHIDAPHEVPIDKGVHAKNALEELIMRTNVIEQERLRRFRDMLFELETPPMVLEPDREYPKPVAYPPKTTHNHIPKARPSKAKTRFTNRGRR